MDKKVRLISNGVDVDLCKVSGPDNPEKVSGRKPGMAMIFSLGRLIKRKGFDMAIEAMAIVHHIHPDVRLIIAGEGENLKLLQARITELALEEVVTLAGRLSHHELMGLYADCDIFLMPNRTLENGDAEGFGLVFLEANAFRKPVIGGRSGGAVDAIIHEKTGLLVDGTSAQAIAEAIIRMLEDEPLKRTMGENGYRWALDNDVKCKVDEFVEYCEQLVSGR